jgi:phosphoribosylformylglycinamidine (FGAM) synthase-like amidotransferase family enzyme
MEKQVQCKIQQNGRICIKHQTGNFAKTEDTSKQMASNLKVTTVYANFKSNSSSNREWNSMISTVQVGLKASM